MHATNTEGLTFRPATAADVAALAALENALFAGDAWSPALVADAVAESHYGVLVALDGGEDGRLIGYATTAVAGDIADLLRIGVATTDQRRGVARQLLDQVVRDARIRGADRMLLEVSSANTGARSFYDSAGFARIDRRKRYYHDGSDALVLQLVTADGCTWTVES